MNRITYKTNFEKLCEKYDFGKVKGEVSQISGGLTHRMFKVETTKGTFAIKVLNPHIMLRKTAMANFIFSEKVAKIVAASGISAIPAITVYDNAIHEVDGQYYLVFPWLNGSVMDSQSVDIEKCKMIGKTLAQIHNLDFSSIIHEIQFEENTKKYNWSKYAEEAINQNLSWANEIRDKVETLYQLEQTSNEALKRISKNIVVSHRDLDPKNVLWGEDNLPLIIDWESAREINPTFELIDVSTSWSGNLKNLDKEAFCAVVDSYIDNGGKISDSIEDVLQAGFSRILHWLAYNINRSLGIESSDEEERELGKVQCHRTLKLIEEYANTIPMLLSWF